jgi:hypothetical protein
MQQFNKSTRHAFFRRVVPLVMLSVLGSGTPALADSASDMAEMQRKLNAETMEKPFSVEDTAKIDAYVADAMKRNLQPRQAAPSDWQPGYTCDSYYRYHHSYLGYRDCVYYHRYYGRYW